MLTLRNCKLGNIIPAGKNLIIMEEGKNGLQRYIKVCCTDILFIRTFISAVCGKHNTLLFSLLQYFPRCRERNWTTAQVSHVAYLVLIARRQHLRTWVHDCSSNHHVAVPDGLLGVFQPSEFMTWNSPSPQSLSLFVNWPPLTALTSLESLLDFLSVSFSYHLCINKCTVVLGPNGPIEISLPNLLHSSRDEGSPDRTLYQPPLLSPSLEGIPDSMDCHIECGYLVFISLYPYHTEKYGTNAEQRESL